MTRLQTLYRFLGKKLVFQFLTSIVVGLVLSGTEVTFAYGLQAFLTVIGVASADQMLLAPWFPSSDLNSVLVALIGVSVIRGFFQFIQEYTRSSIYENFKYQQRSRMVRWAFYGQGASTREITTLFNERVNHAGTLIMGAQGVLIQATSALILMICMFRIEPKLTAVLITLAILLFLPIRTLNRKTKKSGEILATEWSNVSDRLLMSLKNILLIRVYGLEQNEDQYAQSTLKKYIKHCFDFFRANSMLVVVPPLIGVVLICSATLFSRSSMPVSPGELVSYFYLFIRFSQNVSSGASAFSRMIFYWPQGEEVFRWWQRNGESPDGMPASVREEIAQKSEASVQGPIGWDLRGVSYEYPGTTRATLKNLDLKIAPGGVTVVTGSSGVGKSTLLNLILGEIKPSSGSISVCLSSGDRPLHEVRRGILNHMAYVGPETFLIEGTIRENLMYGMNGATTETQVQAALIKAECEFVRELPLGLNHRLTEQGQGLSAGQKQRLALARALLRNPKALILDEATANLDEETEARLIATFKKLKGEMTIVAAAHRPAILTIADHHLKLS